MSSTIDEERSDYGITNCPTEYYNSKNKCTTSERGTDPGLSVWGTKKNEIEKNLVRRRDAGAVAEPGLVRHGGGGRGTYVPHTLLRSTTYGTVI